jgi:DNA-binding beta-propeller fold protein YncE
LLGVSILATQELVGPKSLGWGALAVVAVAAACTSTQNSHEPPGGDSDPGDQAGDGAGDGDEPLHCTGRSDYILVGSAQTLDPIVEDPERCLLYGVDRTSTQVYFIDTIADEVRAAVAVGDAPVDLTLSHDRAFLYVAVLGEQKITVLDAEDGHLVQDIPTTLAPYRLARGTGSRLYYVEEAAYAAIREVDTSDGSDTAVTDSDFHEPDLEASADGTTLYLGESELPGSRLFRFDASDPLLPEADVFTFDGGFTLPSPKRRIHLAEAASAVYFADRAFRTDDLGRMLGWVGDQVVATSGESNVILATAESLYDGQTFVRFAERGTPGGGAVFSSDAYWFYEFDAVGSLLRRTRVSALLGTHRLGGRLVPPGALNQHRFNQFVADPDRPVLYGIDSQQNQLVVIDRESLLPLRAEIIGSAPTDIAFGPSGEAVVATFGATEFAVLDLDDPEKALQGSVALPGNPFRIAISSGNLVVYAEQDQYSDMGLVDFLTAELVSTQGATVFQPDVEFDSTGRYLFAGESAGPEAVLRKFDLITGEFVEVDVSAASYSYPSRRLFVNSGLVFYAGHKFDGDLEDLGDFEADIVALSPDGRFACSRRHIYDVATLAEVGGLPTDSNLVTVAPDSTTVYQFDNEIGALFVQALPAD